MYHVPLVPRDAGREETMFRIEQALNQLMKVSDDVFNKVDERIERIRKKAEDIDRRTEMVENKLEQLKMSDNIIVFTLPRQLPKAPASYETPSTSLFRINADSRHFASSEDLPIFRRADDHMLRPCEQIDFTAELRKPDKFFLTSQVMNEYKQKGWEKYKKKLLSGLRELPQDREDFNIAELFYAGTSIPCYEGVTGDFKQQQLDADDGTSTRRSGRNDEMMHSRLHEQLLEDTALSSTLMLDDSVNDNHPLAFRMDQSSGDRKPILEMPDSLPNLKGHAQDFTLRDLGIDDDILPDLNDEIITAEVVSIQSPEPSLGAQSSDTQSPPSITLAIPPPIIAPTVVIPPVIIPVAPILPPMMMAPPPPPPPPPSAVPQTPNASATSSVTFSPTKSVDGGRSDLMAAIRAAGGASNAKLSKVTDKKRRGKFDGILESSALRSSDNSGNPNATSRNTPAPGGGDLMSALSKALDARRKAISGRNDRASTSSANQATSSIPAPPNFDDDEWD